MFANLVNPQVSRFYQQENIRENCVRPVRNCAQA